MSTRSITSIAVLSSLCWAIGTATVALADYPVAGTAPYQRPEGAPAIQQVEHSKDWRSLALTGVSKPYPKSLSFLENQGNWYTPFTRPGMVDRYDIRGWHTK